MQGTAAEKAALVKSSNIKAGIGFVMLVGSRFLGPFAVDAGLPPELAMGILIVLLVVGLVLWIWGLRHYAMSKGYHAAWGFLGLLSILGLLILALLPNRYEIVAQGTEGDYPRTGGLY